MRIRKLEKAKTSTLAAPALCLLLALSAGACGSSTDVIFVPSQVLAEFAVFQSTTNKAAGPTIENYAGAIFYQGLTTKAVSGGTVSVVDPTGAEHVMTLLRNPAGAPYYLTTMPTIALGGLYVFRVTLEDGTRLESSVTAPAQALTVTDPIQGETLGQLDPLVVAWTGGTPAATKKVSIVIRRASTEEIFSVLGLGKVQTLDTGTFNGGTVSPPISVAFAQEVGDVGTGTRYLTVTRNNTISVGGFYAGSFAQGSLIYAQEVVITPP